MINLWRKLTHRHDFSEHVRTVCDGVTLGWSARPEPCYSITERCSCGKERTTSGWLLPLKRFKTDAYGWPIDKAGNRMGIAP